MSKSRIMKKHIKIVRDCLNNNIPVPHFYVIRVHRYAINFVAREYLTVFRPWWYDQMDRLSLDFLQEYKKHCAETERKFYEITGIKLDRLSLEILRHKRPKRKKRDQTIRLAEPIQKIVGITDASGKKQPALGGKASVLGALISFYQRCKMAMLLANERIKKNFVKYLRKIKELEDGA